MEIRTWYFVLEAISKCTDWLDNWVQINHKCFDLEPFDIHKDDDLNYVCMIRVNSCNSELDNLIFRAEDTEDGVKITAFQAFDITD